MCPTLEQNLTNLKKQILSELESYIICTEYNTAFTRLERWSKNVKLGARIEIVSASLEYHIFKLVKAVTNRGNL